MACEPARGLAAGDRIPAFSIAAACPRLLERFGVATGKFWVELENASKTTGSGKTLKPGNKPGGVEIPGRRHARHG